MRELSTALLLASILAVGSLAAPSLYAQEGQDKSGSMMGRGMMGGQNTRDGGGMMGMMNMMTQMGRMMDQCSNMMSGGNKPNDQWKKNAPSDPENKG